MPPATISFSHGGTEFSVNACRHIGVSQRHTKSHMQNVTIQSEIL